MQNLNFTMSPHHFDFSTFNVLSKRWSKLNTFVIILLVHVLIFTLLIKQNPHAISELNQQVREVKIFDLSLGTVLEKTNKKNISPAAPEETSLPKIDSSSKLQNHIDDVAKANITTNATVRLVMERPIQIAPVEFDSKPLTSLPINNDLDQLAPNSKINPVPVADSGEESSKELRIGELNNNIIEILQLGSSKASYSIPDFSSQSERVVFQVEVGDFPDIEAAIINHIISHIRSKYTKDIIWNSKVKARQVKLSMLPKDHAALEKFLRAEIFGKNRGKDYSYWDKSKF
jgi:hypothetical protein